MFKGRSPMKKILSTLVLTFLLLGCTVYNLRTDGQNEHQDEPDGSDSLIYSHTIDAKPTSLPNLKS